MDYGGTEGQAGQENTQGGSTHALQVILEYCGWLQYRKISFGVLNFELLGLKTAFHMLRTSLCSLDLVFNAISDLLAMAGLHHGWRLQNMFLCIQP